MTQNRSVSASFSQNFYHLDLVAQNGGSVQGAGTFAHNTDAVISAMPDEGYSLVDGKGLVFLTSMKLPPLFQCLMTVR